MSATEFHLTTHWTLDAPFEAVWQALMAPEEWPSWWPAVVRVERLQDGDANGIGAIRRMTWRTALPYTLTFSMRTTHGEPMRLIERRAEGELDGVGRWTLALQGARTQVRYDWIVEVTRPSMRLAAPMLRAIFTWNHGVVMRWGNEGLTRELRPR
jgi:Polyketide cyclase / dehydrase and lipid transport